MKLYFKYFAVHLKTLMEYKASFLMLSFGQLAVSLTAFLSVFFIMRRFESIGGFSASEVYLCFSISFLAFSIAECFFRGFDTFGGILRSGSFDRILVRPKSEVLQIVGEKMEFTRLGRTLQAAVTLAVALATSEIAWTADKIALLVFMELGALCFFTGCFILYAGVCFFTLEGIEAMNILTDGMRELSMYPLSVYGKEILRFCTFVVPVACAQYYPLL